MKAAESYLVYADGSCLGNPGPGGWGVVIINQAGELTEDGGGHPHTTNNRMELTAAIEGLRRLPSGARAMLRSDSEYLVKSVNLGWRRNANTDLWEQLDRELSQREVKLEWVRGHSVDQYNQRADRIALAQAQAVAQRKSPAIRKTVETAPVAVNDMSNELAPLLREGEQVRRCLGCGARFVARDQDYCNHVACQLKQRSEPHSQERQD
ncbi:MAG TPA: ribonuclease H [Candidatus Binataceae bacterium]|nr:ribonuclease H [Candidatus Binataceae bacterium]